MHIFYNDEVDMCANEARDIGQVVDVKPSLSSARSQIKKAIHNEWLTHIKNVKSDTLSAFLAINPECKPLKLPQINRKLQVMITYILTEQYNRCYKRDFTWCDYCEGAYGTFKSSHYLLECPITSKYNQPLCELLSNDQMAYKIDEQGRILLNKLYRNPSLLTDLIKKKPPIARCEDNHVRDIHKYIPLM